MKTMFFFCLSLLLSSAAFSQTEGYKVGDVAIDFNLPNANVALSKMPETVGLAKYPNAKGFIVIFTCNHCPYSIAYEDRIIALHNMFAAKGYPVIAISSNDAVQYPDDSFDNMTVRANEKQFPFVYLYDESQDIAKAYGAKKTPHVYVLKKVKKKLEVQYIGAIDDATELDKVSVNYLQAAMEAILKNKKPAVATTKAVGCSIKWKK